MTSVPSRCLLGGVAALVLLAALAPAAGAAEPTVLSSGHFDFLDVRYEGGDLRLRVTDAPTGQDYAPAEVVGRVLPGAATSVPDNPAFAFLGSAGDPVWILPQTQDPGLLWPGYAADKLPPGVFENDRIALELAAVEGPGAVSMFTVDGFGTPRIVWSSHDGLPDTTAVAIPSHVHVNWAFAAEGPYTLTFRATGALAGGGSVSTGPVPYRFVVGEAGADPTPPVSVTVEGMAPAYAAGSSVSLTAVQVPAGSLPDHQWLSRCPGGAGFAAIPGATAPTYAFIAAETLDGCEYRVRASRGGGAVTDSAPVTLLVEAAVPDPGPNPGSPGPGTSTQLIVATVAPDEGALTLSVDPLDRTVTLPAVQLDAAADRLTTGGDLRPVTVVDTRAGAPGWSASAVVADFVDEAAEPDRSFDSGYLGWAPAVLSQASGQGVVAGPAVATRLSSGLGLGSTALLASAAAGSGRGTARLGAGLVLEVPTETAEGTYRSTMTLTVV